MFLILLSFLFTHSPFKFICIPLISLYLVLKCYYFKFSDKVFNSFFTDKRLIYLGTISFGIYLFHLPMNYYLNKFDFISFSLNQFEIINKHGWLLKFPLYTGLSIVLAGLSFRYIESPLLKLKDRYFSYTNNLNES
jgi:peptidoglycan/LPS O-acetylase OafA/YrhL